MTTQIFFDLLRSRNTFASLFKSLNALRCQNTFLAKPVQLIALCKHQLVKCY